MKFFKQLIVTVALAMSAVVAHADTYVPKDIGSPGVYTNTWTFNDIGTQAHVAGADFEDYYVFNVPDAQNITVSVISLLLGGTPGVSFTGGGFVLFTYSDFDIVAAVDATQSTYVSGGSWVLGSGTYGLYVAGTYLANGASYAGQILGTPLAVPEPSSIMLLLSGMALLGGVAQRRRRG